MISLPMLDQTIVKDSDDDFHIDQNDLNVTLTYAEHEMMCDLLQGAVDMMNFACPYGAIDMPSNTEFVRRFSMIENLRERFNTTWQDRFNTDEIH